MPTDDLQPQNLEVEQSIIAACLMYEDDLEEYVGILKPNDFYRTAHQTIFSAMVGMANNHSPVKAETLAERLNQIGKLEEIGGALYLSKLLDVPAAVDPGHYAGIIKGHALRRQLIKVGNAIVKSAYRKDVGVDEALNKAQTMILNFDSGGNENGSISFSELSLEAGDRYVNLQKSSCGTTGVPSGFYDLDRASCGFQNSELGILAARPAMGKTALAVNMSVNAAKCGYSVGIFSLEMSREQLFNRAVSSESGVNLLKFSSGRFSADDWQRITEAQARLYEMPIHIDDTPGLHYVELRRRSRRWKNQKNIKIIFIDYLQLMEGDKQNGRVEEVSSISRNLKGLAKELNIPVVCLSQLNRAVEQRDNKRPRLSDLRDSGAIEQDADLALLLYRGEVYQKTPENSGIAELAIAKHRNGPTGKIFLQWSEKITKFNNFERICQNESD